MNLDDLFNQKVNFQKEEIVPIFVPLLEEAMEKAAKQSVPAATAPVFRASSMGYCGRYIQYQLKGYEREESAKSIFTLNLGTAVHEVIQAYIKKMTVGISSEDTVTVEDIPFTTGHYDYLLKIGNKKYLLEIKTCNVEAFQRLATRPAPYAKHKQQATFYMKALGVTETIFLYVNKNGQLLSDFEKMYPDVHPLFVEIRYFLDEKLHQGNVAFINEQVEHFRNGTMPEYKRVSQCSYCQFVEQCKVDRKAEKKAAKETS